MDKPKPLDLARSRRRRGLSRTTGVTVGVAAAGGVGPLLVAAGLALTQADSVAAGTGSTVTTGAVGNAPDAAVSAPADGPGAGSGAGAGVSKQRQSQQRGPAQVAPGGGSQPQAQSQGS